MSINSTEPYFNLYLPYLVRDSRAVMTRKKAFRVVLLVIAVEVMLATVCCGFSGEEFKEEVVATAEKAKEILGSWTDWASDKFSEAFELMKTKHEAEERGFYFSAWHSCRDLVQASWSLVQASWSLVRTCLYLVRMCLYVLSSCASLLARGCGWILKL